MMHYSRYLLSLPLAPASNVCMLTHVARLGVTFSIDFIIFYCHLLHQTIINVDNSPVFLYISHQSPVFAGFSRAEEHYTIVWRAPCSLFCVITCRMDTEHTTQQLYSDVRKLYREYKMVVTAAACLPEPSSPLHTKPFYGW